MSRSLRAIVLVASLELPSFALQGCANVSSSRTNAIGVGYSVPMRYVQVEAIRVAKRDPALIRNLGRLRTAYLAAAQAEGAATEARNSAQAAAVRARALANAAGASARPGLERIAEEKEAEFQVATTTLAAATIQKNAAQTAFERAYLASQDARLGWDETLSYTLQPAVADPDHYFTASLNAGITRSANADIRVDENGLLQSANVTVSGDVDDIIIGIADTIATSSMPPMRSGLRPDRSSEPECSTTGHLTGDLVAPDRPQRLTFTFDPADTDQIHAVNRALCENRFTYRVAVSGPPAETQIRAPNAETLRQGLAYRQARPWVFHAAIDRGNSRGVLTERSFVASLPNGAPINVLPYGSAVFVTERTEAVFSNGSLASVQYDRPSEVGVLAQLPGRALREVTQNLTEFVRLRVDYESQRSALHDEEVQRLNDLAEMELAEEIAANRALVQQLEQELATERARRNLEDFSRPEEQASTPEN